MENRHRNKDRQEPCGGIAEQVCCAGGGGGEEHEHDALVGGEVERKERLVVCGVRTRGRLLGVGVLL